MVVFAKLKTTINCGAEILICERLIVFHCAPPTVEPQIQLGFPSPLAAHRSCFSEALSPVISITTTRGQQRPKKMSKWSPARKGLKLGPGKYRMGGGDHLSLHHHLFPDTAFLLRLSSEGPRARFWNANWSRSQTISNPLLVSALVIIAARSLLLEAGIAFVPTSGWVIRKCSLNQHLEVGEVQYVVNRLTSELLDVDPVM